jgi:hypothetical protein
MPTITKEAGTVTSSSASGTRPWVTPENIQVGGTGSTSCSSLSSQTLTSYELTASNFGFALPKNAAIEGVQVRIKRMDYSADTATQDHHFFLKKSGASVDKATGTTIPAGTPADLTLGGSADIWFATLNADEVNDNTNFVVMYQVIIDSAASPVNWVTVYELDVTVTYTIGLAIDDSSGIAIIPRGVPVVLMRVTLTTVAGRSIINVQGQISTSLAFSTTEADSGVVAKTANSGESVEFLMAWTPTAANTYYGRVGVQDSGALMIFSAPVALIVAIPTIDSIVAAQTQELLTITANVTDTYRHPPSGICHVDDVGYEMEIIDRGSPSYQYRVTIPVERGAHTVSVTVSNIWAIVISNEQTVVADYELTKPSVEVYREDEKLNAWNCVLIIPCLPSVPSCSFECDVEVAGVVTVIVRSRGWHSYKFTVTGCRKSGSTWTVRGESRVRSNLTTAVSYDCKQATAWEVLSDVITAAEPARDYSTDLSYTVYAQQYRCRVMDIITQLTTQAGVMMWLDGAHWKVASLTAPATGLFGLSKREAMVEYESDEELWNHVRAHYYVRQFPVPETALTEADAGSWTGTITNVQKSDLNLIPDSGARYMLRSNGNVSRTSLTATLAQFDRIRWKWLPETAATMTIVLKQDASNYLTYVRAFRGAHGAGFIASGATKGSTATYTVTAPIRLAHIQGEMTDNCNVTVALMQGATKVWESVAIKTQNKLWYCPIPDSIMKNYLLTSIVLSFTNLYVVGAGYGVNCASLRLVEWKNVVTSSRVTKNILRRYTYGGSMSTYNTVTSGDYKTWYLRGTLGYIPTLNAGESIDIDVGASYVTVTKHDMGNVSEACGVSVSDNGAYYTAETSVSGKTFASAQPGDITSAYYGTVEAIVTVYTYDLSAVSEWQAVDYTWASSYHLWDSPDIPLSAFTATGAPRTLSSIEITCAGIAYWDTLVLYASNPTDQVVDVASSPGDRLYQDEGQQYQFNSWAAANAWATGILARMSKARRTYAKTLPLSDDISIGDWVDCDGELLQVVSISYNVDDWTQTIACGVDAQTLNSTLLAHASQLDLLKRQS